MTIRQLKKQLEKVKRPHNPNGIELINFIDSMVEKAVCVNFTVNSYISDMSKTSIIEYPSIVKWPFPITLLFISASDKLGKPIQTITLIFELKILLEFLSKTSILHLYKIDEAQCHSFGYTLFPSQGNLSSIMYDQSFYVPRIDQTTMLIPLLNDIIPDEVIQEIRGYMGLTEYFMSKFLTLLNCKNIELREATYEKKGKIGVRSDLDYREIYVKLPSKQIRYKGKETNALPIHELEKIGSKCSQKRGHFKTFTEEAPLFGRHVGTWWWHPIMNARGTKDYIFEVN